MGLCDTCTDFFCQASETHHTSFFELHSAWKSGCYLCTRLFEALSDDARRVIQYMGFSHGAITCIELWSCFETAWRPSMLEAEVFINRKHSQLEFALALAGIKWSDLQLSGQVRSVRVQFLEESAFFGTKVEKPTSSSTISEESWNFAVKCMQKCDSTHEKCKERQGIDRWHPTRLLDIGAESLDCQPSEFRLVHRSQVNPTEPYVTLSHRWGSHQFPTLEVANMEKYAGKNPIAELPQTFQDAMLIARRLSIRYIWIDCLCIIQDGDEGADWKREANMMHMVYTKSYCNISAAWTVDPSHGLFFNRNPSVLSPVEVSVKYSNKRIKTHILSDTEYVWDTEVDSAPLNQRGWVLQERLLAPRVLQFCRRELFWECCETASSETYPEGFPWWCPDQSLKQFDPSSELYRQERQLKKLGSGNKDLNHPVWNRVLKSYANCKLTKRSDKLIAIAGIAKHMKSKMSDQYIAGLWKSSLATDVLWSRVLRRHPRIESDSKLSQESSSLQMPSFTWASMTDKFCVKDYEDEGIIVEVECVYLHWKNGQLETTPVLEDLYDCTESHGLHLRVTGHLKSMRLAYTRSKDFWNVKIPPKWGTKSPKSTVLPEWSPLKSSDLYLDYNLHARIVHGAEEAEIESLYYMPWFKRHYALYSVLLDACGDGIFRRIGILRSSRSGTLGPSDASRLQDEQGNEAHLPCHHYDIPGRHTIFIC